MDRAIAAATESAHLLRALDAGSALVARHYCIPSVEDFSGLDLERTMNPHSKQLRWTPSC